MSYIIKFIKKIVFACFFIYGYNLIAQSINLIIPLNTYTILYTSIFGVFGFISLVIFYVVAF